MNRALMGMDSAHHQMEVRLSAAHGWWGENTAAAPPAAHRAAEGCCY